MSSSHRTPLTAGPYVIRNKKTSTALHIRYATSDNNSVLASRQDESLYRDQQIWWIEPLAHFTSEDDPEGLVYSITNPGTGKSLEADPKTGYINTHEHHGSPWQRWRLREAVNDEDGEIYYNIVNIFNEKVVDIQGSYPKPGAWVQESVHKPDRDLQCWEFVVPAVFFPAGWFHIENVRTGNLLRHNYVSSSPEFLPAPNPLESQYKEQWEFQWTLSNPKVHKLYDDIERKSWIIINRLTKTPLHPSWINMTVDDFKNYEKLVLWTLEMDGSSKWKIVNRSTGCLLQQAETPHGPGTALVCAEKRYHRDGSQGWFLRLPLLHTEEKEVHVDNTVADTQETTDHTDNTTLHNSVTLHTPWGEENSPPDYASSLT